MGQKGGNLFRYLPGDFPPTATKWLTDDNGLYRNPHEITNKNWTVNDVWTDEGSQKGQSETANVRFYAITGDSSAPGRSNHNTRNAKQIGIKSVYEEGVHPSVKSLKEYGDQKQFIGTGGSPFDGSGEQKPASMYEKVGLEFTHQ
jgi:hypothetical protein